MHLTHSCTKGDHVKHEKMHRTYRCALAIALGSAVILSPVPAIAAPSNGSTGTPAPDGTAARIDDRSDPAADERRAANQRAVEKVIRGEAPVQKRGGSQAVQVAPGQWAEYGLEDSDQILSFLIEFGDQVDPRFPNSEPGPLHNRIPEPDRSVDNSTYWEDWSGLFRNDLKRLRKITWLNRTDPVNQHFEKALILAAAGAIPPTTPTESTTRQGTLSASVHASFPASFTAGPPEQTVGPNIRKAGASMSPGKVPPSQIDNR